MKVTESVGTVEGLEEVQKQIKPASRATNFSPRALGLNAENQTLDEVINREKAAARSGRPNEREVLRKQARQARFEKLYVHASFLEDRAAWTAELQRHCKEVYDDEETVLHQEERIKKCKKEGC